MYLKLKFCAFSKAHGVVRDKMDLDWIQFVRMKLEFLVQRYKFHEVEKYVYCFFEVEVEMWKKFRSNECVHCEEKLYSVKIIWNCWPDLACTKTFVKLKTCEVQPWIDGFTSTEEAWSFWEFEVFLRLEINLKEFRFSRQKSIVKRYGLFGLYHEVVQFARFVQLRFVRASRDP
jgi:hypothetical protein